METIIDYITGIVIIHFYEEIAFTLPPNCELIEIKQPTIFKGFINPGRIVYYNPELIKKVITNYV